MNNLRILVFRALLLAVSIISYVYLTYAKEASSVAPIERNVAWNDFIAQIASVPYEAPQD